MICLLIPINTSSLCMSASEACGFYGSYSWLLVFLHILLSFIAISFGKLFIIIFRSRILLLISKECSHLHIPVGQHSHNLGWLYSELRLMIPWIIHTLGSKASGLGYLTFTLHKPSDSGWPCGFDFCHQPFVQLSLVAISW